jgi:hypothetical protein
MSFEELSYILSLLHVQPNQVIALTLLSTPSRWSIDLGSASTNEETNSSRESYTQYRERCDKYSRQANQRFSEKPANDVRKCGKDHYGDYVAFAHTDASYL